MVVDGTLMTSIGSISNGFSVIKKKDLVLENRSSDEKTNDDMIFHIWHMHV